jgi:phage-related tail fiber protein
MNLSRTAYAALRNWAIHNGIAVAVGVWAAGTIAIADNADGTTFRVFDVRGEFPRFLDDGRGVDAGRVFGSWQNSQISAHDHDMWSTAKYVGVTLSGGAVAPYASGTSMGLKTGISGGGEDRPRNVAMLSCIKF